ncbi:autophagy protein 16 [Tieghemostelium lacteum]|uniref:Autophagy protein 16 n=1 Tax=Tieghemostelium lacteum TaxID=361077 RepID=A0A151ZGC4_TIELA|nr:autophagy protein 16 [Tieghemostelium lacteum]|eukprot:KYQ92914.1 autophagy protein 16 [Tieghemostelium lacteum]
MMLSSIPTQYVAPIISTNSNSFNNIATWKQDIIKQINHRNQIQTNNYSEFIKIYNDLVKRERSLHDRTLIYEKEIVSLRNEKRSDKQNQISGGGSSGSLVGSSMVGSGNKEHISDLESKLYKLQEDLTNSYKKNADHASSLLKINDEKKDLQNELQSKDIELERVRSMMTQGDETTKRLEMVIQEKEKVTQILRDELNSLQTEFLHNESKVIKLEQENRELVERWLRKKNEEASMMNEANQFYQKMVEQRDKSENQPNPEISLSNVSTAVLSGINQPISILDKQSSMSESLLPNKVRKKWTAHNSEIYYIAFNSVGNLMATGSGDKSVKIWDALSGSQKSTLLGASQSIMSVQFSPNDECILGTSNDNSARLWNVELGRSRHTLTGHIGKVYTGKFVQDSNRVATGSHDRTIKLWDLQRGYCNRTIFCFSSCNDLVPLNGGSLLCSGHVDHSVRFWDSNLGEPTHVLSQVHEGQITSITNSPVNPHHLLTNSRDHTLKIIDIRTYETVKTFKDQEYRNGLNWTRADWSPDGRFVSSGSIDGSICIWDVNSGKTEKIITKIHNGASVCAVSWNPMGNIFVSADKDKNLIQWE